MKEFVSKAVEILRKEILDIRELRQKNINGAFDGSNSFDNELDTKLMKEIIDKEYSINALIRLAENKGECE